jgi:fatty-acyl-CoA synthase
MAGSGTTLRYGELEENSARLARVLHDAGLRRGDGLALLADNDPRVFEVYWAARRSGLYLTPINSHLAPDEVRYILEDSGAKALVVSAAKGELAQAILPGPTSMRLHLAFGGHVVGYADYTAALAGAATDPLPMPCGADMLYSSGTTGRPKGVRPPLPDRAVDEPGDLVIGLLSQAYGIDAATRYLSPAPSYHSAPVKWCLAVHALGGTVVMMERFDPEGALRAIERFGITHAQFVPTMFVRILKLDAEVRARYDLSSLRVVVHAAAPCPVDVKAAIIAEWGPIVHEYYGQTETLGMTMIDSAQWAQRPGSVGRAALGVIHICDDDGQELPPDEVGTVYFERDALPFSYHNDPERTRAAQHPEHPNWGTVGDVGYLDEDGYLFLTDRKAFMIISGGVNIYPQEIENVLALHPKVLDVAVIGVPDAEMGESVKAFVELPAGVPASADLEREIVEFVRSRIAHYKAPRSVEFVASLPRTPTGKLVKGELKRAVTGGR